MVENNLYVISGKQTRDEIRECRSSTIDYACMSGPVGFNCILGLLASDLLFLAWKIFTRLMPFLKCATVPVFDAIAYRYRPLNEIPVLRDGGLCAIVVYLLPR